jgi:hypothetical protein
MYMPTLTQVSKMLHLSRFSALNWQLTMLSKALKQSADDHNNGAGHDGPSSTEPMGEPGSNRNGNDRTKVVARVKESEEGRLDTGFLFLVEVAVTKV